MFFYEDVTPDRFPMPHALHQCTYRKLWTRWWLFKKKKRKGHKIRREHAGETRGVLEGGEMENGCGHVLLHTGIKFSKNNFLKIITSNITFIDFIRRQEVCLFLSNEEIET